MSVAATMLLSASLLLILSLLAIVGLLILRPSSPRHSHRPPMAFQLIPVRPQPVRLRQRAVASAGQNLRAPPTFPDQPRDVIPPEYRRE